MKCVMLATEFSCLWRRPATDFFGSLLLSGWWWSLPWSAQQLCIHSVHIHRLSKQLNFGQSRCALITSQHRSTRCLASLSHLHTFASTVLFRIALLLLPWRQAPIVCVLWHSCPSCSTRPRKAIPAPFLRSFLVCPALSRLLYALSLPLTQWTETLTGSHWHSLHWHFLPPWSLHPITELQSTGSHFHAWARAIMAGDRGQCTEDNT